MSIPVNASDLIYGRRVESARIEYKTGWNPAKVLHTMCAFANDVEGWGGAVSYTHLTLPTNSRV